VKIDSIGYRANVNCSCVVKIDHASFMQVSLLLSVPHMSGPMRVKHCLRFNLNPIGSYVGRSMSSALDLTQRPNMVKREMMRSGLTFMACLGGAALDFLDL
jgi:hypothetical protein